jgi:hypothetical protein
MTLATAYSSANAWRQCTTGCKTLLSPRHLVVVAVYQCLISFGDLLLCSSWLSMLNTNCFEHSEKQSTIDWLHLRCGGIDHVLAASTSYQP